VHKFRLRQDKELPQIFMKNLIAFSVLGLFSLNATSSLYAAQAIYKTSGTVTLIGNGAQALIKSDFGCWVVDPSTWKITAIGAFTHNGKKLMQVVETENYNVKTIAGPGGTTYTSFAKGESPSRQTPTLAVEAAFGLGVNSLVNIESTRSVSLPKSMKTYGFGQIKSGSSGYSVSQSAGRAVLDMAASRLSNSKETYSQAVDRIVTFLKSKGYTEASPRKIALPKAAKR